MSLFVQWASMKGYALYVWSAYGLVLTVLIGNVIWVQLQGLRIRNALLKWRARL